MTTWKESNDSRIKKRDGVYWARFTKKGKRVEVSLETKNFEVAKRAVEDIEAKVLLGKSWKKERQLFADAWIEFLADKRAGNKVRPARDKTLYEYAAFGGRYFIPFFGKMRLGDIGEDEWNAFIEYVQKESPGIKFFNIRKYMSGFFTWARLHGKVPTPPYLRNPDAKLERETDEHLPGKAYTLDELKRMRASAANHGRFYLFMLMAQYMGMRPSEITQLKRDRVNLSDGVIELRKVDTKTNTARLVPIHPLVRDALEAQLQAAGASDYVFPHAHVHAKPNAPMDRTGFKRVWAVILRDAGVEGRIYDFRHTFITNAIRQGMNPAAVAKITGTSIRVIEKHYLHLGPRELNLELSKFEL